MDRRHFVATLAGAALPLGPAGADARPCASATGTAEAAGRLRRREEARRCGRRRGDGGAG